jgi:hypothetical protein
MKSSFLSLVKEVKYSMMLLLINYFFTKVTTLTYNIASPDYAVWSPNLPIYQLIRLSIPDPSATALAIPNPN